MNAIEHLTQSLYQKNSIEECSLHELQSMVRKFPYFAIGHLLLAEKIKTLDSSLYNHQIEKASLFFHNPLWLDYILNKEKYGQQPDATLTQTDAIKDHHKEKDIAIRLTDEMLNQANEGNEESSLTIETISPEEVEDQQKSVEQAVVPVEIDQLEPQAEKEFGEEKEGVDQAEPEVEPISEIFVPPSANDERESAEDVAPGLEKSSLEIQTGSEEKMREPELKPELSSIEKQEGSEHTSNDTPLKMPGLKIEAVSGTSNDLLFEPYHTVDYFASQGIKPEQNEKPKDRFGQQLRSFTDWLKMMKRLPGKEITIKMEPGTEKKVQSLAEHSIEDREIVTEAMAEVWIKQGDNQRAIDVYSKLSLLNPSKSHYFAAKIEQLKTN